MRKSMQVRWRGLLTFVFDPLATTYNDDDDTHYEHHEHRTSDDGRNQKFVVVVQRCPPRRICANNSRDQTHTKTHTMCTGGFYKHCSVQRGVYVIIIILQRRAHFF